MDSSGTRKQMLHHRLPLLVVPRSSMISEWREVGLCCHRRFWYTYLHINIECTSHQYVGQVALPIIGWTTLHLPDPILSQASWPPLQRHTPQLWGRNVPIKMHGISCWFICALWRATMLAWWPWFLIPTNLMIDAQLQHDPTSSGAAFWSDPACRHAEMDMSIWLLRRQPISAIECNSMST